MSGSLPRACAVWETEKEGGRGERIELPPFRPEIENAPRCSWGRAGWLGRLGLLPTPVVAPAAQTTSCSTASNPNLDRGQTGDRTLARLHGCRFFEIRPDKHTNLSSSLADAPPRGNADEVSAGGDRLPEKRQGSFFRNASPPPPPQKTASIMSNRIKPPVRSLSARSAPSQVPLPPSYPTLPTTHTGQTPFPPDPTGAPEVGGPGARQARLRSRNPEDKCTSAPGRGRAPAGRKEPYP